jgi:DNA repair protein RecO (recombination protein O)
MVAARERQVAGLCLRATTLGEHDRLLTLLSDEEGLVRLAASGSRKPRSSLAAVSPLTHLRGEVHRGRSLDHLGQISIFHNYGRIGQQLETLAAAQWLLELCLMLVPQGEPVEGVLSLVLHRLDQLEALLSGPSSQIGDEALAIAVQTGVQLLQLGGYGLPLSADCRSAEPLQPPLGNWNWRCSLLPAEGFCVGPIAGAVLMLNPSELALLQRLVRPQLPRSANGDLLGPKPVWERLLVLLGFWCREHLGHTPRSLALLRQD